MKDQTLVGVIFEKILAIKREHGLPCTVELSDILGNISNKDSAMRLFKAKAIPCFQTRIDGEQLIVEESQTYTEYFDGE